jgi:hypothetical protein
MIAEMPCSGAEKLADRLPKRMSTLSVSSPIKSTFMDLRTFAPSADMRTPLVGPSNRCLASTTSHSRFCSASMTARLNPATPAPAMITLSLLMRNTRRNNAG